MIRISFVLKLFLLVFVPVSLNAYSYLKDLDKTYIENEFRIYYTLEGKNKLPSKNQIDSNENLVPDYVENIARQLNQASKLFANDFGFIHPLKQERFKNKAQFIDIHLIALKVNGAAGDVVDKKRKALVMKLSVNLISKTLTPLHEYFHLIQYGYSMFNNRWSLEGQARWAENSFRKAVLKYKRLPNTINELKKIMNKTYEADSFWNRLAYLMEEKDGFFGVNQFYYYINSNKKFIKDQKLYGIGFFKKLLEEYAFQDKKLSHKYNYSIYSWTEIQQKSLNNNVYILDAISKSLQSFKSNNQEILDFIQLIETYKNEQTLQSNKNLVSLLPLNYMQDVPKNNVKKFEKNNWFEHNEQNLFLQENNNMFYFETISKNTKQIYKQSEIFPAQSVFYNKKKVITHVLKEGEKYFYIAAYKNKTTEPFALFEASLNEKTFNAKWIKLNNHYKPIHINIKGDFLYVLVESKYSDHKRFRLLKSAMTDLTNFQTIMQFNSDLVIDAFYIDNKKYYFKINKKSKEIDAFYIQIKEVINGKT